MADDHKHGAFDSRCASGGSEGQGERAVAVFDQALIAITLDLEMVRHYPKRGMLEWDYEKGNVDAATKRYAVRAAEVVASQGGVIHYFLVGRALEQADVRWLQHIHSLGHPIGNHTYDHVYLLAQSGPELQYRFRRCPWLVEGRTVLELIEENVRWTSRAFQHRLGFPPAGFRAPGGYSSGLRGRGDLQRLLQYSGFDWVSTVYPRHMTSRPGTRPDKQIVADILRAQQPAQPFHYPSGLVELPMCPVSDVAAFRGQRWRLSWMLEVLEKIVEQALEKKMAFVFLGHPAVLLVEDPDLEILTRLCRWIEREPERARLVTLDELARRYRCALAS